VRDLSLDRVLAQGAERDETRQRLQASDEPTPVEARKQRLQAEGARPTQLGLGVGKGREGRVTPHGWHQWRRKP